MKKILSIFLATMMLCFLFSTTASAVTIDVGNVTGDCTWSLNDGVLIISGNGRMADNYFVDDISGNPFFVQTPWDFKSRQTGQKIEKIVIEKGVTYIGKAAFRQCTDLVSVTIPNTVIEIGDYAFSDCDLLKSITLPNSLTSIGKWVFYDCDGITHIELPNGLKKIGAYAFNNCDMLERITLPKSLTSVGYYAFKMTLLCTVNYHGCELDKDKIIVDDGNSTLFYADWSYDHKYSNNCDKSCNVCGKTRTVGAHTYSNSCDTTCNYCNAKRTIKHTYTNACDTTCNVCKAKRTIKHTYSNNCDTSCNVCKATRTITHAYKTTTTKATLSKKGSIVKKCTVCSKVASSTVINYAKTFKLSATSYTYDGKVKAPSVVVKDSAGKTLKKNTDYTVTYVSGRKNVGTYKVTIKGKGNYTGTKTLTFKINPAKVSSYKLSTTAYTYDGKVKTPTVTVKNSSGTKLTKNTHYMVTYSSGRKNVGTYKVTIKGKGNYTGTKTLIFKIIPKAASVNTLTAGNKKLTVKLNRSLKQSTGYQIQYSTNKTFKNAKIKTITSYKTSSITLTGIKAKTTYYVRVRTYKTIGKTKYYSNWSSYKHKKTK